MDPIKEKEFEDARRKEVDDKVLAEIDRITKYHGAISEEDKAFLRARQSYLSRSQMEEYAEELKAPEDNSLVNMTRPQLEQRANELGITTPEDKKLYRTNADLIQAIEDVQA